MNSANGLTRRGFLSGGASLVVAISGMKLAGIGLVDAASLASGFPETRVRGPAVLDTWLAVHGDGTVSAYFGKTDMAQGVDTAIAQVVAEELDLHPDRVSVLMGDTALTANQGGLSASSACSHGANPLRNAAAEARRILLEHAAAHFNVAASDLYVEQGMVIVRQEPARRIGYGQLITDASFDTPLEWNGREGNFLNVTGQARPKSPDQYQVVGQPLPRKDLPGKILASAEYCHHVSLPGMLHGRIIRPPVANAVPAGFNKQSISGIRDARVVHEGNFIGVVAGTEWDAVRAARQLEVSWSDTVPPFPDMENLYDHIRAAPVVHSNAVNAFLGNEEPPDPALVERIIAASHRKLEAEYETPFQSHARMAPSVGLADVRGDMALIYSDTQKPHNTREGIATLLGLSPDRVQVIWKPGPGSYGRSDADEAAFEAALLSRKTGRPVRVQWMRDEGIAWDPKAPAAVITVKAGIDADGNVSAWYYRAKGFSGWDVRQNASNPGDTLAGMLLGHHKSSGNNFGVPMQSYAFPNRVQFWETITALQETASPLRTAHMRSPQELQIIFAQECFVDEVAAATGQDPIAFRLRYLTDEREIGVLKAAARASNWQTRPSPAPAAEPGNAGVLRGRGVASGPMFGTYAAVACDIELDSGSGRIWPRRITVAHDCGLVINPLGLRGAIEGNILHGLSRAMWEEVRFDRNKVTSNDWVSYPILDIMDVPGEIEIVILEPEGLPPGGAGEAAHSFVAAALGNAIYDATGVRYRHLPLTPDRIKAGLA